MGARKPRTLKLTKGRAKGVMAEMFVTPGQEIAEGSFWTFDPRELRRLSAWLIEAATYLEAAGYDARRIRELRRAP